MSERSLSQAVQKELMQLFLDVPGLTDANDKYSAEIRRREDDKIGVRFAVKEGVSDFDPVSKILENYMIAMVKADIKGVSFDEENSQLVLDDDMAMVSALNAYVELNPEKLDPQMMEAVGFKIQEFLRDLVGANTQNDKQQNTQSGKGIVRGNEMARQMLAIMSKIPQMVCGVHDCEIDGFVNSNGSIEIGFNLGDHNTGEAKEKMRVFVNCLDMACAENPERFGFDPDENRYLFKSVQEIYEACESYLDAVTPQNPYKNRKNMDFKTQNAVALYETLQSVFDDFVPTFQVRDNNFFSKPRSINAVIAALRTFLSTVDGADILYINPDEDKDLGLFKFTLGCSKVSSGIGHEDYLAVMEDVYESIKGYRNDDEGLLVSFHNSGDNIDIETDDLRKFLPFFREFFAQNDWGGPENVRTHSWEYGLFDNEGHKEGVAEIAKSFDELTSVKDAFAHVPMRSFVNMDDLKVAYMVQNGAKALISLENLEATILQEYEGSNALSRLTARGKAHVIH